MNKEIVTDKQGICLVILFTLGTSMLIGMGGDAKQDAWLSVIVGYIMALPAIFIYSRLLSLFPEKNLFQIFTTLFGKFFGVIMCIIYTWFALHLGTLVLRNYYDFTNTVIFPDTPPVLPIISFLIVSVYAVKSGIEVMGRCAEYNIWMVLLLIFSITIILSLPSADINNLKPVLYDGIKPVFKAAFSNFTFPYAETIIFTMCFSGFQNRKSAYRIYFIGLTAAFILLFMMTLRNLLVQGPTMISYEYFPSYSSVSIIRIGEFLQRLESAVAIVLLINVFIKLSACLLAVARGLSHIFSLDDYRFIVTPCGALMGVFCIIVYKNTMEMRDWAFKVWPYYAFIFQAILPVFIYIFAEIKVRWIITGK